MPPSSAWTDVAERTSEDRGAGLSDLERAILLTVLYADVFDYPLSREEIYQRLVLRQTRPEAFRHALAALLGRYLSQSHGYVTWVGRESLVQVRRRREAHAQMLWAAAERYARWLARVPFVRMVAVSGSLAVENAEPRSDIDLFCITEARRLWVARLFIVPLSKLTRHLAFLFPRYLCPNYLLTLDTLEVEDRNLFTAHEVAQATPLWGEACYRRFRDANRWIHRLLPGSRDMNPMYRVRAKPRSALARWGERVLRGRLGDVLDRWMHRLFFTFYRRRAERKGWDWQQLKKAYQRNRYTVPEGGYARVVRDHFVQRVHARLGSAIPDADLERLFPFHQEQSLISCYDWAGLFAEEYDVAALGENGAQSPVGIDEPAQAGDRRP